MSDPHTTLKLKGWGKESSKKKKGGCFSGSESALALNISSRTVRSSQEAPGLGGETCSLSSAGNFKSTCPTFPGFKSGHVSQPFLDFYNPMIETIVDKSTEYIMPCLLPIFCFQFQNGYWWTDSLHSWMPGGKAEGRVKEKQGRAFWLRKTFILLQQKF